ncbi:MAG TPA: hypothetical protein VMH27_08855 [Puia sp.]|nr:hypothetical protein [Puia sp.]
MTKGMTKSVVSYSMNNYLSVYIVAFISILYLAFLVSSAQRGVFFSSDGGVKYLMVRQLSGGHGFKYMYLPQPQWVQQIWSGGFFPFKPPFLYPSPGGYLFVFPPAFQIMSSFFYTHFGDAGLYVLPVASTLLLWLSVILVLRRCSIAPPLVAAALFILVFCSPLTLYGAIYWEHMTAILFLFAGLSFLVRPSSSPRMAIVLGFLSGLAVWFRPEAMMMNALYAAALIYLYTRERGRNTILFLISLSAGFGSFLLFNRMEYGSFLGVHGRQVLTNSVEGGVEVNPIHNLIANNLINFRHFPFILLLAPVIFVWLRYRRHLQIRTLLLIAIALLYSILTPFMVPNDGGREWGARYFLPLITVVLLALLLVEKEWDLQPPIWATVIAVLIAAYSFQHNTYKGGIDTLVWENHHRITPDLKFLDQQPGKVVVVPLPYIAMELGYTFYDKYFFLAPDDSSLHRLLPQLKRQGITHYTYIYDVRVPGARPGSLDTLSVWPLENGDFEFREHAIP